MKIHLTFELTLLSDYHVGAGRRAGPTVDSALLRDYDRAPLLRGTLLAGLLRDGLLDLLELSPAEKLKPWVQGQVGAEARLFGTAARRKRWAYSSARPIAGQVQSKDPRWGGQDVMRVRVNPRTRRADPKKLFNQEEGDARLKFRFTAACEVANDQDVADAALLVAAARLVRHFGSARRRGRGECRLELVDAEGFPQPDENETWTQRALAEFKSRWLEATQPSIVTSPAIQSSTDLSLAGDRLRFRVIACAAEPIIIAKRSEAANAYETLSTIPGAAILGVLANRAAHSLGLGPADAAPAEFVTLFLRGGVRVSSLTPAFLKGTQLYPTVPASPALFTCENYPYYKRDPSEQHQIHDALKDGIPKRCPDCQAKMSPLTDFLTLQPSPHQHQPQKREEMHISINRATGRVKTGDLYQYIALEAGQWFIGELDCANLACWKRLQTLTGLAANQTDQLRIGKASRRGYGLIHVVLQPLAEQDPSPLTPSPLAKRVKGTNSVRLMLLTDAIISDPWGRFYASIDRVWVAEMLGLKADEVEVREFANSRSVDSFNTHRRMPRWRDEAIIAGATADLQITPNGWQQLEKNWREAKGSTESGVPPVLAALRWKIAQIEAEGVGLRRHEGFGRVAFNHPIFPAFGPIDDFEAASSLSALPSDFRPLSGSHALEEEAAFRQEWTKDLDKSQNEEQKKWDKIDAAFEPVARLLFLSRQQGPEKLKQLLEWLKPNHSVETDQVSSLSQPEYLWGKHIEIREAVPKIDTGGLNLIIDLVNRLASKASHQKWTIGLELLAERIAIAATKQRQQEGK